MPVGVPKVAYLIPGDEEASWVDLYNRLYRQRWLFLGQEVEGEVAHYLMGIMIFLNIEDKTRDIFLYINSPGGDIISGIGVYDTMQFVGPDVHTLGLGVIASMASFILVGGEITKRVAYPRARVMIHQPASSFYRDKTGEFILEAGEMLKLRETVAGVYVQRTGKPLWVVSEDLERDVFMSATEAQAYGIVDLVAFE